MSAVKKNCEVSMYDLHSIVGISADCVHIYTFPSVLLSFIITRVQLTNESLVGVRRVGRVVEYRVHYYLFDENDRTWETTRSFDIELVYDKQQSTATKKKGGNKKEAPSVSPKNMEEALTRFWAHIKRRHGINRQEFMKRKSSPAVLWCSRRFYRDEQARYQESIGNPQPVVKDRAGDHLNVSDPDITNARNMQKKQEEEEYYGRKDAEVLAARRAIDSNSPMTEEASETTVLLCNTDNKWEEN
ncbi:hypothetical protein BDZ89DRAFT_1042539 [Hymenopellis radicata]|nr:hypothetical protein BDZ89DRAFT_1042539 [Hymenopellis radicata]